MDNELTHYGVKGMKWGIRKNRKSDKERTRGWSKEAKRVDRLKKKSYHELTNKELKEVNNRGELEKKYRELNPSTIKKGATAVKAAVAVMGTVLTVANNIDRLSKLGKQIAGSTGGGK